MGEGGERVVGASEDAPYLVTNPTGDMTVTRVLLSGRTVRSAGRSVKGPGIRCSESLAVATTRVPVRAPTL